MKTSVVEKGVDKYKPEDPMYLCIYVFVHVFGINDVTNRAANLKLNMVSRRK